MSAPATVATARPGESRLAMPAQDARVGVGILGATGYVGAELVRLVAEHPHAELRAAGSRQSQGRPLAEALPAMAGADLVLDDDAAEPSSWRERGVDLVFAALPHGAFAARARAFLEAGLRVVDLSSDFRLRSAGEYRRRYGLDHPAPDLLATSIYGLTEWCGDALADTRLVANPGCYATAVLLAVLPVAAEGWWGGDVIVANALSGVSGAGRAPALGTHFVEVGNGASPYKVGESHAHLGEIGQAVRAAMPRAIADEARIIFNPHLVPMARGIVASIVVPLARSVSESAARELFAHRYAGAPFVRVLSDEALPETRFVRGSNRCDIAVRVVDHGRRLLAFAAIDNLIKGAAGQAIQNWNRMQGWPEETGLPRAAWACA